MISEVTVRAVMDINLTEEILRFNKSWIGTPENWQRARSDHKQEETFQLSTKQDQASKIQIDTLPVPTDMMTDPEDNNFYTRELPSCYEYLLFFGEKILQINK